MKNRFSIYLISTLLAAVLLTASCEWVDPDLNIDPDNARDVYSGLILPSAQGNLAYIIQGFDYVGVTGMWLQYFEGLDRQAAGMYNYNLTSDDCDNFYGSLYTGVMQDCENIIKRTSITGAESPHLRGMAKVLKAVALASAVGVWGDIPYSTALQGNLNLKPTFDSEESVYTAVQTLLTEAIADLSSTATDFENAYISTAGQDLIYGGDFAAWKRAAYSLKARYELRLSRKGATKFSAANVLANLALGITDNDQDFQLNFAGNAAYVDDNPLWIFTEDRYGYAANNPNFLDLLDATGDPRIDVYDDGDYYIGGPALGYPNSPALFMSNFEALFIKAECLLSTNPAGAATAYNAAVTASLEKWDVADAAWLATNAAETGATITLSKIMNAKYIAMYAQGEAWSDYRRHQFAYPLLTPPVDNQTLGVQPSSFPYPTNEKVTNAANVPARSGITNKLWAFQ